MVILVSRPAKDGHTLGVAEVAALKTLADGTVDAALEHGVGGVAQRVVGLHVLLDGLTAARGQKSVSCSLESKGGSDTGQGQGSELQDSNIP